LLWATPAGRAGKIAAGARGAAAIGLGALAIADWETAIRLAFLVAGTVAIIWGVSEVLRIGMRAPGESTPAQVAHLRRRGGVIFASVVGGLAAAGLLALGGVALATDGGGSAPPPQPAPCNGHAELCDRTLDRVAMVASHNAMSVASDPGWLNAHFYNPLVEQLDAGVRGLLIDTYLGQETAESGFGGTKLVQTDLSGETRSQVEAEIGSEALAAAERLGGTILYGEAVAHPKLYLCHGLCEIGATDAEAEFERIRRWLDDHPDQVLVIVIQDESSIQDDVAALEHSGLAERAWPNRLTAAAPLPTLRQMIDAGKTAVIMHESNDDGGPAWYQNAYAIMQETPYLFPSLAAIEDRASCVPNRGPHDAPLFLLNHWLDKQPVQVTQAEQVNVPDVLLDRARLCQKVRGQLSNLVAVNFIEVGDAFAVVDELNGVPGAPGG
jgi:hypothetical protein